MKEIIYNKLIRDKIPKIIENVGKTAVIKTLEDEAFSRALDTKLLEELNEYLESKKPEELADMLEVIYAIASLNGISKENLEALRKEKEALRGGFKYKLWLEKVIIHN